MDLLHAISRLRCDQRSDRYLETPISREAAVFGHRDKLESPIPPTNPPKKMNPQTVRIAACFVLAVSAWCAPAQTNSAPAAPGSRNTDQRGHRYLVIVETSKEMDRRSEGVAHTILDTLGTGLKGQVKQGDTLGLWTFNETLLTGKFPVRKWGPDTQAAAATSVVEFLKKQKYEKQGLPEKVLPTLCRVVTNSELITVVLISTGNGNLQGTGFDEKINATYAQWRSQQQKKKMPFVTLLRARHGVLTDFAVSPAPWAAELPPLPPETIAQAKPAAATNTSQTAAKPAATAALYFSGKKTQPTPAPQPPIAPTNTAVAFLSSVPAQPVATASNAASLVKPTNAVVSIATPMPNTPASSLARAVTKLAETAPNSEKDLAADQKASLVAQSSIATPEDAGSNSAASASTVLPPPEAKTMSKSAAVPLPAPAHTSKTQGLVSSVLLIVAGCLAGALLMVWLPRILRQRVRTGEQVSLITRSLDHSAR